MIDDHEHTNAASGCTSNDGEVILAAVREQNCERKPNIQSLELKLEETEEELRIADADALTAEQERDTMQEERDDAEAECEKLRDLIAGIKELLG